MNVIMDERGEKVVLKQHYNPINFAMKGSFAARSLVKMKLDF
jgi:hypothetical protein